MRQGEHVPPLLATVTYLGADGAPTLLLPATADERGIAEARPHAAPAAAFFSRPRPGKHLAFDGRMLHGCPHEYATPPPSGARGCGGCGGGCGGRRVSLLVNVWTGHQPLAARPLPADVAALLSDSPATCALGDLSPAQPEVWPTEEAEERLLRVGRGGTHPPLVVRGLPPPGAVAATAASADFLRIARVSLAVQERSAWR